VRCTWQVGLEVLGVVVPIVDLDTRGTLAAHLQDLYCPYGVPAPDASAVVAYLVGVGLAGVLVLLATIWAGWPRVALGAAALHRGPVRRHCSCLRNLTVSEYGQPILPTWLGVVGLLPCLAGLVAVVLLWRRGTGRPDKNRYGYAGD
jgi:hypothetical protein